MHLEPGATLGPYEIVAPLGAGGMGEVYKARDTRLGREVAVKILSAEGVGDPERQQRFLREAQAASRLNHPHIVTVHDIAEAEGIQFIVMEYVPGKTLAQTIAERSLSTGEVLDIASQVASALAKAHSAGITHRDLKPANIMVTEDGHAKILDFGLAKLNLELRHAGQDDATLTGLETRPGYILGTVAYMSPEQAEGKPVDARSDMFSFGVVLYELLTRRRAFCGDSPASLIAAILRDEPRPLREFVPSAPPQLERVISRCLRKDPKLRFPTMADVKDALEDLTAAAAESPVVNTSSIAVLPFANLSPDHDNEYFSEGLAEDILSALAKVKGLRVIARTSAFLFRGTRQSIREIGEKLQVANVLEGSLRRAGDRIRVTAQLINAVDESQIWSERYDRDMIDVFAVQDEIAQAIVEALKVNLTGPKGQPLVTRGTDNLEAYECFLKGRFHYSRLTPADIAKAIEYQKRAITLDPQYPDPYADLAGYHLASGIFGLVPPKQAFPYAKTLIDKCLSVDQTHAEAHTFFGRYLALHEYQWEEAERHFRRAIDLNPAVPRSRFYFAVDFLRALGRLDEAIQELKRAAELDPLAPLHRFGMALLHSTREDYPKAIRYADLALEVDPNFWMALWIKGAAQLELGRAEEAVRSLEAAAGTGPRTSWIAGTLARSYLALGRDNDAAALLAQLEQQRANRYVPATSLAFIQASLGDIEGALAWMETAYDERDPALVFCAQRTGLGLDLEELIAHPRWATLLTRMNLPVVVPGT